MGTITLQRMQELLRSGSWRITMGFKLPGRLVGAEVDNVLFSPKDKKLHLFHHQALVGVIETSSSISIETTNAPRPGLKIRTVQQLKRVAGNGKAAGKSTASVVILHLCLHEAVASADPPVSKPLDDLDGFIERMRRTCVGKRVEDIEADGDGVTISLEGGVVMLFDFEKTAGPQPRFVISAGDDTGDESFVIT